MGFQQFNTGNLDDETFKRVDRLVKLHGATKSTVMKKILMAGLPIIEEQVHKETHQNAIQSGYAFCPSCGKPIT